MASTTEAKKPKMVSHFFAGAVAGTVSAVVLTPIDVIKTRMQNQTQTKGSIKSSVQLVRHIRTILHAEGVAGLWRGVGLGVVGVVPSRALYFEAYRVAGDYARKAGCTGHMVSVVGAATASVTVSTVLSPLFMVKTQLQLQTHQDMVVGGRVYQNYTGIADAVKRIHAESGFAGFYRGLSAAWMGSAESAIQLLLYSWLKAQLSEHGLESNGWSFAATAAGAKMVASTVTYPHEVVRTRMRCRTLRHTRLTHTFRDIWRAEGWRGMYGGLGAHLMKVVPNAAIVFALVDVLLQGTL